MSLIDKFRAGYTESERSGLVSAYDGTSIDVNVNLTPANGEPVYGAIQDPPLIVYEFVSGPSPETQALIDRLRAAMGGAEIHAGEELRAACLPMLPERIELADVDLVLAVDRRGGEA